MQEVDVAKRMTQLRVDLGPYEGHMRRRDQPGREGRVKQRRLPRMVDQAVPDVYWAETSKHMLTACAGLSRPREVAWGWLKDLA